MEQDPTQSKSNGRDLISQELNHHIDTIKLKVMQIHKDLEFAGTEFDAQDVICNKS